MTFEGKKILVTGAGGFIGSHLTEELVKMGAEVTAMIHYNSNNSWGNLEWLDPRVKDQLKVIPGNIEDAHFVHKVTRGQDIVFHLAALIAIPYSYDAPLNYVRTNVEGTTNIMHACMENQVSKVVHTSTSETYGTAIYAPIDEKHPLQGQSPYSATKIGADKIAESYYLSFGLPVATIRPFNTFGPRQSARAVIPTIISQGLAEKHIKLGSLTPVRDLNYVKDTVQGFLKIAQSANSIGQVINVGQGQGITIGELAQKILQVMGVDKPIVTDPERIRPEKSEVFKLICDHSKAKELVGWEPSYTLEQGLIETVEFVTKNINLFKTNIYNK
ncbi:GDP-mannose 4,6-dehydratase [Desulfotomaculum sp. 1211_IL3151]|uniref:GDP-mannose 4,6-dehydratase n=1 Tax=Desulfotomaculum sp. 1211_IL3151 TaxID=3084055 RepID=UPI002FDAC506